jgi:hypothetical protein
VSQQKLLSLVAEHLIDPNIAGQVWFYLSRDRVCYCLGRSMQESCCVGMQQQLAGWNLVVKVAGCDIKLLN